MKVLTVNGFKRKIQVLAIVAIVAAMVLSLNLITVNASNDIKAEDSCMVKNDGKDIQYSLDDGKTWKKGKPDNYNVEYGDEGQSLSRVSDKMTKADADSLSGMVKDGKNYYSNDGGETWSENLPDGYTQTVEDDGSISIETN